jgi:hypothetical protein
MPTSLLRDRPQGPQTPPLKTVLESMVARHAGGSRGERCPAIEPGSGSSASGAESRACKRAFVTMLTTGATASRTL